MERFDRFYALHGLLSSHKRPIPLKRIMGELECAKASATGLIGKMRLHLDTPIEYDRQTNGYYYNQSQYGEHPYELTGLWFNTSERHPLLTSQTLLGRVDPGIYSQQLNPLRHRIEAILQKTGANSELIMDILKYGTDVEVTKPASLRSSVKQRISCMMQPYT